ncbi:unnamed protein product [Microthlaspi erraticum]|uniref:Integrase catalytic domain-containing protein n=1 Tax=Microthlaspi erraticum TaxID=1685480 RepID=A0A6D2KI90_9BRAS|nr:unnamed protein product [Microthlaspi erraticum]
MNVYLVQGLKSNLISVSQLCDEGLTVWFNKLECKAIDADGKAVLRGVRSGNNCYMWDQSAKCLSVRDDVELWHKRLGHMNIRHLTTLVNKEIVRGVPKLKGCEKIVCGPCNQGKQVKVQHKKVPDVQSKSALDLVHMDFMGPMQVESIAGKRYVFVLVDDYSRYTWVRFIRDKSDTMASFKIWALQVINEKGSIKRIRSDHGGEFQNEAMKNFCNEQGIAHQFSAPRTPQMNGVVDRKNRTLQEMARAMIHGGNIPVKFWAEAINTACYIINRVYIRKDSLKTPYEFWKGKIPNLSYFRVFGCSNSSAFRVFNLRSKIIMESVNVVFDDRSIAIMGDLPLYYDPEPRRAEVHEEDPNPDKPEDEEKVEERAEVHEEDSNPDKPEDDEKVEEVPDTVVAVEHPVTQVHRNHSSSDLIGDINDGRKTRGIRLNYKQMVSMAIIQFECFVSTIEPRNHLEALDDADWIISMEDELEEFVRNDVWELVPLPDGVNVVGTKWIFKNKTDDVGSVVRNKSRLVAQGYSQVEGVDFDETFAPVARLESIRLFLGMACILNFKVHQMGKKSAFLNSILQEEVYVAQPKGFEDPTHPDYVYKLKKALYGLKQAPRAWYERLTKFLTDTGYIRGTVDKTLFILEKEDDMIMVQIYEDDIIFGGTSEKLVQNFVKSMTKEFKMSMVGELKYFLGLQVNQTEEGIFISQSTYAKNLLVKFGLEKCKEARTPMSTTTKIGKDEHGEDVDVKLYRGMIGSLLYLTASRPDLCFSVGNCQSGDLLL